MARNLQIVVSVEKEQAVRNLREVDGALDKTTTATKGFGAAQVKQTEQAMGGAAAIGMLGKAFAGLLAADAIIGAIKSTLEYTSSLEKMKAATDISFRGLQQLENIAVGSNTSLQTLTTAVLDLQRRLATGDDSAVGALRRLKINFEDFMALKGDQQFLVLGRALGAMTNEIERNKLAFQLFGRSYKEILPAITSDVDGLTDSVHLNADATIKRLAETEQAWAQLKLSVKRHIVDLVAALRGLSTEDIMIRRGFALPNAPGGPDLSGMLPAPLLLGMPTEAAMTRVAKEAEEHLRTLTKGTDAARLSAIKAAAEYLAFWNFIGERRREDDANRFALLTARIFPQSFMGLAGANLPAIQFGQQGGNQFGGGFGGGLVNAQQGVRDTIAATRDWGASLLSVASAMTMVGDRWSTVASGVIRQTASIVSLWQGQRDANGTLIAGSQNRGAAIGQIISLAGQMIPTGTTVGKVAYGAAQGAATGAMLGSVMPGVGTLVGAGVGAVVGGVVGWVQSQKAHKQVNDLRDAFVLAAGGLAALDEQAHKAGVTLDAMLRADTVEEYEAAIHDLNAALKFQDQSWQALQEAIDRYGFTIDELGPKLSQQLLDQQVMQLIADFRLLEGAGVDVETISIKMADAINAYVHDALRAGATIPSAMREILQQLVTMGLLTDENGNLITDLEASGLHFADSMTEQFQTLIETIQKMIDAISRLLGLTDAAAEAINNLPTPPTGPEAPNGPDVPQLPTLTAFRVPVAQSRGAGDSVAAFQGGGVILPFISRSSREFPEMPVSRASARRTSVGGSDSGGGIGETHAITEALQAVQTELVEARQAQMSERALLMRSIVRGIREGLETA